MLLTCSTVAVAARGRLSLGSVHEQLHARMTASSVLFVRGGLESPVAGQLAHGGRTFDDLHHACNRLQ